MILLFYLLILVMPLENHPVWGYHFAGLTLIKYLGLGCVVYALGYLPFRKHLPPLWQTTQARLFSLFFLLAAISYFTLGRRLDGIESPLTMYVSFFLLFFVVITLVDTPTRFMHVLFTGIGSIGFASIYVIREWQKSGFASGFRPGWVVGDANYFTVSVAACLPLALYFTVVTERRAARLYCAACSLTSLGAAVLGASRGGFIAITMSCMWLAFQTKHRAKILGILILFLTPVFLISPTSPLRRLLHPNWTDIASTSNHEMVFKAGLKMVAAHPLFGVGLGNFSHVILNYAGPQLQHAFIAHDTYLEVASEMGIPALLVYVAMLVACFWSLMKSRKTAAALKLVSLERAAVGTQAGLIGSSVAVLFVSGQNTKLYWLMIFLSMALSSLLHTAAGAPGVEASGAIYRTPRARNRDASQVGSGA